MVGEYRGGARVGIGYPYRFYVRDRRGYGYFQTAVSGAKRP